MADLDELLKSAEETLGKGGDLGEIETDHHGKEKSHEKDQKSNIEEEIKQARIKANEAAEEEVEIESGETIETEEKASKAKSTKAKGDGGKKSKKAKVKVRSGKYVKALELVDKNKKYTIAEALELVKKTSLTKFDGNVEVHIRLIGKSGKPEQVRGMISYPHTTGKKVSVEILDEATIEEIIKSGKADADVYLTTPADMPKVAKLARILGPKGKMPNPKSGTITLDPAKTKAELEGGRAEFKSDSYGIVHQIIGKVSGKAEELAANYKALVVSLPIEKAVSINISATMGPSIKIQK